MKSVFKSSRCNQPKRLILLLFLLLLFLSSIGHGLNLSQQTLDFIYIDSSVDESAGGHTAIRFDQTVFHYQYYPAGFFLLIKEDWPKFRYHYNDLQNRTLSVVSLPVSTETYQKIKMQFLTRYIIQEKRFSRLNQLKIESIFFQNLLSSNSTIPIKGLGFFTHKQKEDPTAILLRSSIERRFGTSYIKELQHELNDKLEKMIEHLQPIPLENVKLNLYTYSTFPTSNTGKYFELRELQEALCVLAEARSVSENVLVYSSGKIARLTDSEIKKLQQYRENIKDSILRILTSPRPDKGVALLVQAARYQSLSKSINSGHLITLDPFSEDAQLQKMDSYLSSYLPVPHLTTDNANDTTTNSKIEPLRTRNYYNQLKIELLRDAQNAKHYFFTAQKSEDILFNQLEGSLGRLWEINNAEKNRYTIKIEEGILLPGKVEWTTETLSPNIEASLQNIAISDANESLFKKQLHEVYAYNLFKTNCVTEIFETIYSCFSTPEQSKMELGGYMKPGENLSFIPFSAFHSIQQNFTSFSIEILPSYRKRQLDEIYKQRGTWALLKESNTLTSTVYFPWEGDSSFLFFTDNVVLTRPLLGVGNVLFATVNTLAGIVWLPIDKGTWLRRSMRGVVFSLPELAFFNIRKGTFPAIAFEEPHHRPSPKPEG